MLPRRDSTPFSKILYIFYNKIFYIGLLSLNLVFAVFLYSNDPIYSHKSYLVGFDFFLIILNLYHLFLLKFKQLGQLNYKVEFVISISRMAMLFLAGSGLGAHLSVFSPVGYSFWLPLFNLLDIFKEILSSGGLAILSIWLITAVFIGLEFYNFFLLRRYQLAL